MGSSLFGVRGESTYFDPLAITIGLQRAGQKAPFGQGLWGWARNGLGKGRELVIGAIPLNLLVEFLAIGGCANPQVLDLGDIGEVVESLDIQRCTQDGVVRAPGIDPGFGRCGK